MRERPIIFSGEMVRAILEGRKTQTRRVIQYQPPGDVRYDGPGMDDDTSHYWEELNDYGHGTENYTPFGACPYGSPGDRLWVRETWRETGSAMRIDGKIWRYLTPDNVTYAADLPHDGPFRSPIHMPRTASRIPLEICSVRVERLQNITKDDVWAEGVQYPTDAEGHPLLRITGKYPPCDYEKQWGYVIAHFASAWDALNAKRGFGWETNPFVWVIEFRRVE